jgi:hypothetical protein
MTTSAERRKQKRARERAGLPPVEQPEQVEKRIRAALGSKPPRDRRR